jgi:hypothetical protein
MENQTAQRPASDLSAFSPKWVSLGEQDSAAIARRQARVAGMLAADRALTDEQRAARNARRDAAPLAQYMNDVKPFSIWAG